MDPNIKKTNQIFTAAIISLMLYLIGTTGAFSFLYSISTNMLSDSRLMISRTISGVSDMWLLLPNINSYIVASDNIKQENIELQSQIVELKLENIRLQDMLNQKLITPNLNLIDANIINFSPRNDYINIDKGTRDNIFDKQVVIINNYLVGFVCQISYDYSKVCLITDQSNKLTVSFLDQNQSGIASYVGSETFKIQEMSSNFQYKSDELVMTKPTLDIPSGLLIGKATALLSNEQDIQKVVQVKYPINIQKYDKVYLILK